MQQCKKTLKKYPKTKQKARIKVLFMSPPSTITENLPVHPTHTKAPHTKAKKEIIPKLCSQTSTERCNHHPPRTTSKKKLGGVRVVHLRYQGQKSPQEGLEPSISPCFSDFFEKKNYLCVLISGADLPGDHFKSGLKKAQLTSF